VNFGPVTPEFKRVKVIHPRRSAVWLPSLVGATAIDLAGISHEFSGTITAQFCFTYTLAGVTVIPHGLHAMLCHAFLVFFRLFALIFGLRRARTSGAILTIYTSHDVFPRKGVSGCQGRPCDGRRHCVYVAMFYTRFQSAVNHVDQTTSVQN